METADVSRTGIDRESDANLLPPPAQTNLQLYRQLHEAGYTPPQLISIRNCYELASNLFAGQLRGTGKPFVAHLVGTASVLAAIDAPPVAVGAGLLHAAYEQGDFGLSRWRHRRERVRAVIGQPAEALVWRYFQTPWVPADIDRFGSAPLSEADRLVVLMRLANELDDNLDLAMLYCDDSKDAYRDDRASFIRLARLFGVPRLANTLAATYRESDAGTWARSLSLDRPESYQLASSFGLKLLRPAMKLRRFAQRLAKVAGL